MKCDGNIGQTHNFGADAYVQNALFTYTSATGYTVTVPSDDDVYARTKFIGAQYDTSLTASIINPQLGYAPGSTLQMRYRLVNE